VGNSSAYGGVDESRWVGMDIEQLLLRSLEQNRGSVTFLENSNQTADVLVGMR
jgi:hypothetical protein